MARTIVTMKDLIGIGATALAAPGALAEAPPMGAGVPAVPVALAVPVAPVAAPPATAVAPAAPAPSPSQPDNYTDRVLKYIPGEAVAAWVAVDALLAQNAKTHMSLYWGLFVLFVILTPIYLWRVIKIHKPLQLAIQTIAFPVWVFAIGGPFAQIAGIDPVLRGVCLPVFVFAVAAINP